MKPSRILLFMLLMQCGSAIAGVSVPASNLKVVRKTCRSMDLTWNRGNGQLCLVTCRKATAPIAYPNDGWQYFPDSRYAMGTDLGNENYCVFSGLDSAISVKNLDENTAYIFEIFEFDYNPFVYLMAEAPYLKDSTHWFSGKFTTTVLNSCKVRNKVALYASAKASFAIKDYEWRFAFDTLYGKEHMARMEASGENAFTLAISPAMGCREQSQRGSVYIIPGADSASINADKAICTGEAELFTSTIHFGIVPKTAYTRTWVFENGDKANLLKLYRTHPLPGKYSVRLVVYSLFDDVFTGCSDTFYRNYSVLKSTDFTLGNDTCFARGNMVVLRSPIEAKEYTWDGLGKGRSYYVTDTGYHFLTITDAQGCHTTDTILVTYCAPTTSRHEPEKSAFYIVGAEGQLFWRNAAQAHYPIQILQSNGAAVANLQAVHGEDGSYALKSGMYLIRTNLGTTTRICIP